jgi:acarbose 7IV-phosphotransferase
MPRILVAGLLNLETTLKVDAFPVPYESSRFRFFGVHSTVSGVGYNVAKALHTLGSEVRLCSLIGRDLTADVLRLQLERDGLALEHLEAELEETPQSVILYDLSGQRALNTDLKDIQERVYPTAQLETALTECDAAVICNINFARPALHLARGMGIPIITDLHAISNLDNPYDTDFLEFADVLFFSAEKLEMPERTAQEIFQRFPTKIIVIGFGARGSLLCCRDREPELIPARSPRGVVSTVGAGDALLSAFAHFYIASDDPRAALERATLFAGWKIGATGGSGGFLSAAELEALV